MKGCPVIVKPTRMQYRPAKQGHWIFVVVRESGYSPRPAYAWRTALTKEVVQPAPSAADFYDGYHRAHEEADTPALSERDATEKR
jgi:hypothetical protein